MMYTLAIMVGFKGFKPGRKEIEVALQYLKINKNKDATSEDAVKLLEHRRIISNLIKQKSTES